MAEVVAQEHRCPYVSCIRSFGRPILPPLMTDEKRRLMRHFRALACEREAARDKRKREVLLGTLHEATPGPPPPPHHSDDSGNSLDVSQLSSLSLVGPPFPSPTGAFFETTLGGGVPSSTPSSATLVPSSISPSSRCDEEDSDSRSSSSLSLAIEVPEGTKVGPSVEKDLAASTNVTVLVTTSTATPVATPIATPIATPVETPVVTPTTSPSKEGCFSTKLSVPSLCRSRSFVVERPSLALLLWKERCRDSHSSLDDVKIVAEPKKSPDGVLFQQSPEGNETHATGTRAGEHADITQSSKVSVQEAGISRRGDRTPLLPTGRAEECVHTVLTHDSDHLGVCLQVGGRNAGTTSEGPPLVPAGVPAGVPASETYQAPGLLDRWGSATPHFTSRVCGDDVGRPLRISTFARQHEMVRNIVYVPANSSSKLAKWNDPSSFLAWNPFDGVTVIEDRSYAKYGAADNTLSDVPNVPKEGDSAEETAADDMFADALDDGREEFASASQTSLVTEGTTFGRVWDLPKLGKTFVSDSDQGFFVPVSTSSNRHSLCSSSASAHSSFSAGKDFPALNSSCDAEDEEQYEDAQEPCDQHASELGDSVERAESPLNKSSADGCGEQPGYPEQHVPDSVPTDHLCAQDLTGSDRGISDMPLMLPAAAAAAVAVAVAEGLPVQPGCSAPPTSVTDDSTAGPMSLAADLSLSSCWNPIESHAADLSSLTSTSIHLDLLSETRQSLHPRWRRCFDRLTAMARGHLTRRLMKTHRVRSIIQTIKDTLECALRLHGEPHIRSGLVTPQDVELHQRLITQLTSACYELHDVFFNIPVAERMRLIAQLRAHRTRPPASSTRVSMEPGVSRKVSSATQKVLERRISRLASQDSQAQTRRPTAVVRAQTFTMAGPSDTCHTAGATAPSGTTRKICRLPMYKV